MAVIFIKKKRIRLFNSMESDRQRYLTTLYRYIQDKYQVKKEKPFQETDTWELIPTQWKTPRQRNSSFPLSPKPP